MVQKVVERNLKEKKNFIHLKLNKHRSKNWRCLVVKGRPTTTTHSTVHTHSIQMASAIFILDQKGKILISRNYRGDVPMSVASRFISKILEEEEMNVKPIIEEEGVSFIFVKHNNLYRILISNI